MPKVAFASVLMVLVSFPVSVSSETAVVREETMSFSRCLASAIQFAINNDADANYIVDTLDLKMIRIPLNDGTGNSVYPATSVANFCTAVLSNGSQTCSMHF
jgi:hypothetical protein